MVPAVQEQKRKKFRVELRSSSNLLKIVVTVLIVFSMAALLALGWMRSGLRERTQAQKDAAAALEQQLALSGCQDRKELPFHKALLNDELPLTIGGGIGQSRLCMLLIGCCHIGEVQSSIWDETTMRTCRDRGVMLL